MNLGRRRYGCRSERRTDGVKIKKRHVKAKLKD